MHPIVRLIAAVLFFMTCYVSVNGQTDGYTHLLEETRASIDKGDCEKAAKLAASAFKAAQSDGHSTAMGTAKQLEAFAVMCSPKKLRLTKKDPIELLEESLTYFNTNEDIELRIKSLETLIDLAKERKNQVMVSKYQKQLDIILKAENTRAELDNAVKDLHHQQSLLSGKDQELFGKDKELIRKSKELRSKTEQLSRMQLESELQFAMQKNHVDSLRHRMETDSLALVQSEILNKKQAALLELEQTQNRLFLALLVIVLLIAAGVFIRFRETKKINLRLAEKNQIIEEERNRSEALLLNILPRMVATELKMNGVALAKRYEHTTVFFSDFVNFTSIAERMSPEDLVKLLDDYFKTFDSIITRHNLEKIKTIGDAYMCVGGLPEESPDHAVRVVKAALEIQQILAEKRKAYESAGSRFFDARIGVHTGPVVSGVVGSTKFAFDIWGDTVNVAARMEHSGEPGRVNVSADTYELIKHRFTCTSRGLIPVKNRGDMGMYFVESEIISI